LSLLLFVLFQFTVSSNFSESREIKKQNKWTL
jgi:hypothetical protein